ncbi:MAG: glycosyltransferase, partial [Gemmatimonadota bacterium]
PQDIVRQWMARAAIFSVPSTTLPSGEAEGFGLAFAEAQAMELPVASFAVGGVPEVIAHGETGLLAPDGDTAALARNLLTLLRDPDLCRRYGVAGRARVEERFDLTRQTAKLETLYRRALEAVR